MVQDRSPRAWTVTQWVMTVIQPHFVETAREAIARGGEDELKAVIVKVIKEAEPGQPGWETAQDMAPRDYDRVYWVDIVKQLTIT